MFEVQVAGVHASAVIGFGAAVTVMLAWVGSGVDGVDGLPFPPPHDGRETSEAVASATNSRFPRGWSAIRTPPRAGVLNAQSQRGDAGQRVR